MNDPDLPRASSDATPGATPPATLAPRRVLALTIFQGDDLDTLAHLKRAADVSTRNLREGDDAEQTPEQHAYQAAVDDAAGRAIEVWVTKQGNRAYRNLLTRHVPRDDDQADAAAGWNRDTFPAELLASCVTTEPAVADLDAFLDTIALDDYDYLVTIAQAVHEVRSADPRESRYSAPTPGTDETSASPERLD